MIPRLGLQLPAMCPYTAQAWRWTEYETDWCKGCLAWKLDEDALEIPFKIDLATLAIFALKGPPLDQASVVEDEWDQVLGEITVIYMPYSRGYSSL